MYENQKIYYHVLGQKQEENKVVVEFPNNPKYKFGTEITDDGHYLIIDLIEDSTTECLLYFADLSKIGKINGIIPIKPIVTKFEADFNVSELSFYF